MRTEDRNTALVLEAFDVLFNKRDYEAAARYWSVELGRFSGNGNPAAMINADVVRIPDGKLAEHWDVSQDDATRNQSLSGLAMFGDEFPAEA